MSFDKFDTIFSGIHSELFQLLKRAMLCKYFFFKDKHFDERRTNQET